MESEKLNNVFRLIESGIKLSIGLLSIIIGEKTLLDVDGVLVQVIHQLGMLSKNLAKIMEIKDEIELDRILINKISKVFNFSDEISFESFLGCKYGWLHGC